MTTPAPIVGKPALQSGEVQLAAGGTGLIALLGLLIATLRPSLMPTYTSVAPYATAILASAGGIAHVVRDNGVVRGLALERSALAATGHDLVDGAQAVDPAVVEDAHHRIDKMSELFGTELTKLRDELSNVASGVQNKIDSVTTLVSGQTADVPDLSNVTTRLDNVEQTLNGFLGAVQKVAPAIPVPAPIEGAAAAPAAADTV